VVSEKLLCNFYMLKRKTEDKENHLEFICSNAKQNILCFLLARY
jgi:hypothetical protein